MPHALPLYRADDVRAIERAAFDRGFDAATLMARAGEAVARTARERWPGARRVGLLCGPGNNGGDGYVAALALHRAGLEVEVIAVGRPKTPEAAEAAKACAAGGVPVRVWHGALPEVDLWVDALFGVGLSRAPEGEAADALRALRACAAPVLAVDLPSGLDADRGTTPGDVVPATVTLALIGAKRGCFTAAGRELSGEVIVDALGLDDGLFAGCPAAALALDAAAIRGALPRRADDSHKGRFGRVLCIGGDTGMEGALVLCAEAAARSGAGSVRAWTRPGAVAALQARRPEVMARTVTAFDAAACADGKAMATVADVIVLGPGMGQGPWSQSAFDAARASGRPLVLDADALNRLAEAPMPLPGAVLTPHPGEAARLLGRTAAEVQANRFEALDALVERYRSAVVLKGAGTLVGAPGQRPRVIRAGNPGMASAGMGDVLAGLVAGLLAQGLAPFDAGWVGALAHACAGDRAAAGQPRGLLAGDVVEALRSVLNP